jgi:hypothetical protein
MKIDDFWSFLDPLRDRSRRGPGGVLTGPDGARQSPSVYGPDSGPGRRGPEGVWAGPGQEGSKRGSKNGQNRSKMAQTVDLLDPTGTIIGGRVPKWPFLAIFEGSGTGSGQNWPGFDPKP